VRNKVIVMVSVMLATLIASMDTTIMNTTMPVIAEGLGRFDLFAWAFTSYMITTTILALISGSLSDIYGRKRVFAFGLIVFLVGSLLCGLAQSMVQLVVFRAIQGIGAGIIMPMPAIIAGDLFPIEKRGKIQAIGSGIWGLSAVIAPLFGAFFVEYMTWRWIFYINIPISIFALLALIPYKEMYKSTKAPIDYIGALLFAAGISLLLIVTVVDTYQIVYGLVGAILIVSFYFFEKKHTAPLIPFSIFRNKTIRWMNINGFLAWVALYGTASYIPLFLQYIANNSIFVSGLALLGSAIGWMITAVPTGKWILRYGYRPLLIIGNIVLALSGLLLTILNASNGFWYVFSVMLIQGLAFGLLSTTGILCAQQLVNKDEMGISTSFMLFTRNIGAAIGVTIMGAFLTRTEDFMSGIHDLFLYGLIASLVALVTVFMIREPNQHKAQQI